MKETAEYLKCRFLRMPTITTDKALEFMGAMLGIAGALLMAIKPEMALWAWISWLGSSICLMAFAWRQNLVWLLSLNAVYLIINMVGILNNLHAQT